METYLEVLFRSLGFSARTFSDEAGNLSALLLTDGRHRQEGNPSPLFLLFPDRAEIYTSADSFLRGDPPESILGA